MKTLNIKVFERYMTKEQIDEMVAEYSKHKLTVGMQNRELYFQKPISEEDKTMLSDYLNPKLSIGEIASKYGVSKSHVYNRVKGTALRVIYQNNISL